MALFVALVGLGLGTAQSQSVSLSGVNTAKPKSILFADGSTVTATWSLANPPAGTVTEVNIVRFVNGVEQFGYGLSDSDRCPTTGSLQWTPRINQVSGETYKVRVIWKTVLVGTTIATADSMVFGISGPTRSITLAQPTSPVTINGTNVWQFRWTSSNLPTDAKIQIILQPVGNSEAGGIVLPQCSNTGGYMWWQGDEKLPPASGQYYVTAYFVNEYGVFGAASNTRTLTIATPPPASVVTPTGDGTTGGGIPTATGNNGDEGSSSVP